MHIDDNTDANLVTFTTELRKWDQELHGEPAQINSIGLGKRSGGLLNRTLEKYYNISYIFFFKNFTIFLRQFYLFIFFSSQCKVNYITFIHYWLWKEWIHLYLLCYTSTSTCSIRNDMVPNLTIPIIPSVNSFDMAPTTEVIRFLIIRFWGFSLVC